MISLKNLILKYWKFNYGLVEFYLKSFVEKYMFWKEITCMSNMAFWFSDHLINSWHWKPIEIRISFRLLEYGKFMDSRHLNNQPIWVSNIMTLTKPELNIPMYNTIANHNPRTILHILSMNTCTKQVKIISLCGNNCNV